MSDRPAAARAARPLRALLLPALALGFAMGVPSPAAFLGGEPMELPALLTRADAAAELPVVDWRMLAGLNYRTGELTPALRQVDGKRVRIPGFMVPLEDGADGVDEFLLVPYFGACIHTPPPPPNQIVYVRMDRGRKVSINLWDPVWIEGELRIRETDSPYGAVGHQLIGTTLRPYR